jgi:hypothetical protein
MAGELIFVAQLRDCYRRERSHTALHIQDLEARLGAQVQVKSCGCHIIDVGGSTGPVHADSYNPLPSNHRPLIQPLLWGLWCDLLI